MAVIAVKEGGFVLGTSVAVVNVWRDTDHCQWWWQQES